MINVDYFCSQFLLFSPFYYVLFIDFVSCIFIIVSSLRYQNTEQKKKENRDEKLLQIRGLL